MIIVLMGYMGSGKSFVGKTLAEKIGYEFVDLDNFIEQKEKLAITEIFDQKGAIYFRKKESDYLQQLLGSKDNMVLSTGGGTPCYADNLNKIKNNPKVVSVYLNASVAHLSKTLFPEKVRRPLIAGIRTEDELSEFIGKHLFERSPIYREANYTVPNENTDINKLVDTICSLLF